MSTEQSQRSATSDTGRVDERPARLQLRAPKGKVDLHPIVWDETGRGVQAGFRDQLFEYPPGSLNFPGSIAGEAVLCGTPELQVGSTSATSRPSVTVPI
jgi:hypothetical protein